MTIFPGCKCCGQETCWKCYGKYFKPPVPEIGCYEYKIPTSIHLKAFLTVGGIISTPPPEYVKFEYDVADVQAWVNSLDFNVYLYQDPNSGRLTYRARAGLNPLCQPITPIPPYTQLDLKPELGSAQSEVLCNDPNNRGWGFSSCVNIDSKGCSELEVRPDLEVATDTDAGLKFASCHNLPNNHFISLRRFQGEIFTLGNTPDKQAFQVTYDNRHYISVWGCDIIGQPQDQRLAITGYIQIEFQFATEESLGRCCFSEETEDGLNTCENLTQQECEEKNGLWSAGITCEDLPCEVASFACFEKPPENEEPDSGWVPQDDKCHKTQEECLEECPPDDTTPPGGRTMTTKTAGGPGTELAAILKIIGIHAKEKGCGCKSHAKRMDREGPQWCRDNIETILGWLETEAKKRKLPFVKTAAKQVVLLAIRRSEKRS